MARPGRPRPSVVHRRGWPRWAPAVGTLVVVAGVIAVTVSQLHLNLLLLNGTTTGGDTGAHFMMPQYLRSELLPSGHLTGWNPGWYDGYPMYTFYFLLPDLLVAIHPWFISYDVAFKWGTVLGSLLLPVCAWACGRLFKLRPPVPAALAAATLPFLFDYTFTIYGGNLFSTLAGEYAYSLSLSLALLFLGLMARGLRTGRYRTWTAVVLALCILAHIVPAMFAIAGAAILVAFELLPRRLALQDNGFSVTAGASRMAQVDPVRPRRAAMWWGISTVSLGVLLSGWWLVPFGVDQPYATSMGYANVTTYQTLFFPRADWWALVIAGLAVLVGVVRRSRFSLLISLLGLLSAMGLVIDPLGSLYNVRLLPLWFLCVYLMVGWLFGISVAAAARWWRRERLARWVHALRRGGGVTARGRPEPGRVEPGALAGPILALLAAFAVVVTPFVVPAANLPFGIVPGANQVTDWAAWNYSGYEGPSKDYAEYQGLMDTMRHVGATNGCGRAMWEYNANQDRFGTPEALMLLPYWSGGCIDSMEGLLFESSTTTPYHFLNQAELSVSPSEPMVGLPYGALNVPLGIQHLQLLGVRYFMAFSPAVKQAAAVDPSLRLVSVSGPWPSTYNGQSLDTTWNIYKVLDSPLVQPLQAEPAVLTGVAPAQSSWLGPSTSWYDDPARWKVELAAGGPPAWPRVTASTSAPAVVRVASTKVTSVRQDESSISFSVSRIGTPVLVKVSYFPNWQASGAEGPWRVTPNLMVVVPTSHRVTLTYGTTAANVLGVLCSLGALLALLALAFIPRVLRRWRPRPTPAVRPSNGGARPPGGGAETDPVPPPAAEPVGVRPGPPPDAAVEPGIARPGT